MSLFVGIISTLLVVYYIPKDELKEPVTPVQQVIITESDTTSSSNIKNTEVESGLNEFGD